MGEQLNQPPLEQEADSSRRHKTLGIRLDEEIHAQLVFIAQLTGSSLSDEIKTSIESRIQAAQTDPELIERAQQAREQIEREAKARQAAIAGLFGSAALSTEVEGKAPSRRGRTSGGTTD